MRGRLRWVFLSLAPLLYGCATAGVVRLETGTRPPIDYAPPSDSKAVAVGQREFLEAVSSLTLDPRLPMNLEAELGRRQPVGRAVQSARWDGDDTDGTWGRVTLLGTASPLEARRRFTLVGAASYLDDEERLNMAMSFALDTVWDGVALAVRGTMDPAALRDLVSAA
ncbi:MAG TPA: hypothetical protein VK447_04015, partial [Myxococcaceae bacterium]|nr:hypothetical protein [Myxococcaceae bacterium]